MKYKISLNRITLKWVKMTPPQQQKSANENPSGSYNLLFELLVSGVSYNHPKLPSTANSLGYPPELVRPYC